MNVISRVLTRKASRVVVAIAASGAIAISVVLSSVGTARADTLLVPDPVAYCETNLPFAMQVAVNGWQVQYDQLLGDSYENNWKCEYWITMTIPTGEDDFTLPPFAWQVNIDWNAMCNQQYPGSWAAWIPGPATGVAGAPWGCEAPTGVTYDPAEDSTGVHAVL